jgi:hypothetical protein
MNRGQRFAFLGIAALIAVVAVFVLADSSEDDTDGEQSATTATATPTPPATETAPPNDEETPTPTPTATPEPTPEPAPLLTAGRVTELEHKEGDTIRFRVRSPVAEEVHVHGYDLLLQVQPGKVARAAFPADITGIFEIEFHNSGEQIAELRVEP